MRIGVIEEDFKGEKDIEGFMVGKGMRKIKMNGVKEEEIEVDEDEVVIRMKKS